MQTATLSPPTNKESIRATRPFLVRTFRLFASLKLAVTLLAALATVLAWATVLEAKRGTAYARWYVYESGWFIALLTLLGANIFCAAAIRFPWKRAQIGFVVTHGGLLVLLAGSIQSFLGGVEGGVSLVEGESARNMVVNDRSQITAFWVGRPQEPPFEFTFDAGPVDWPEGNTLNVGEVDGVQLRILGFLRHARAVEQWVPDESKLGGPAVEFIVWGQDGMKVTEGWLVDQQFGDAVFVGPLRLQLERAATDCMLDDFIVSPVQELGEKGSLAIYYNNVVKHVSLDKNIGERIVLGDTGVAVEIAEFLPNASPDKLGRFTTKDDQPKNPMVELRVHLPGEDNPLRQIAFAKDPLLNLDGVYPRTCPVKFRFHHPAIQPQTALEMLQTSDGKLFGRLCAAGTYTSHGELKPGSKIMMPGKFQLEIVEHLPSSKQKVTFVSDRSTGSQKTKERIEPAALVEISVQEESQQVWLRRNDPHHGRGTIAMPGGIMALSYQYGRVPLGFSLQLKDFRRKQNPGNVGNAAFSSRVKVVDSRYGPDREHTISMNQPLRHGKFTLYQSSFGEAGHGKELSSFSVAYDPGRTLKYAGSLMICLGIGIMFYMRAYFFQAKRTPVRE